MKAATLSACKRSVEQPPILARRAGERRRRAPPFRPSTRKIYALLKNDAAPRAKIKQVSAAYGIEPIHVVGAIVGEHTYNVDAYDRLQNLLRQGDFYLQPPDLSPTRARTFDLCSGLEFDACDGKTGATGCGNAAA